MLKIIACLLMLCDHIGSIYDIIPLRIIGRPSMILFAYQIVVGYQYSQKNGHLIKYLIRLFILAIVSQFAHLYAFSYSHNTFILNIVFTWIIAVLCMCVLDHKEKGKTQWWQYPLALGIALSSELIKSEYGLTGVGLVLMFRYVFPPFKKKNWPITILLTLALSAWAIWGRQNGELFMKMTPAAFLSLPIIILCEHYVNKKKKDIHVNKWIFYLFYPAHMVILRILFNIVN